MSLDLIKQKTFSNGQMTCVVRFGTICAIKKNVKNTHGGVLLLVKLQALAGLNCTNGTKSRNAPQIYVELSCAKLLVGLTTFGTLKREYSKAHPKTLKKGFVSKRIV